MLKRLDYSRQDGASVRIGAPRPARKVIYTGHPPVTEQLRGQLRSGSGMTWVGEAGALRAVTPRRRDDALHDEAEEERPSMQARRGELVPGKGPARMLAELQHIDARRGPLPLLAVLAKTYGHGWVGVLEKLQELGLLTFRRGRAGRKRWSSSLGVRLPGSHHVMLAPGTPPDFWGANA